jgi:hypothetical protein
MMTENEKLCLEARRLHDAFIMAAGDEGADQARATTTLMMICFERLASRVGKAKARRVVKAMVEAVRPA